MRVGREDHAFLVRALRLRGQRLHDVTWLEDGRSGSPVGLVEVSSATGYDGVRLLKCIPRANEAAAAAHRAVLDDSPAGFRGSHLVELAGDPILTPSWHVIFQRVAEGDFSRVRQLADAAREPDFGRRCRTVVGALLTEWNAVAAVPVWEMTVADFLDAHVGDRLGPDGALTRWLATQRDRPDRLAAGPLALCASQATVRKAFHGRAHGDLSVRNVLLPVDPADPGAFRLIDYDRYSSHAPLTRDPAHLLISIATERVSGYAAGAETRTDLIRALVEPSFTSPETAGFAEIARQIREGGEQWAESKGGLSEWRAQTLLSIVGCALRAASRPFPDEDRWWCLRVASVAAAAFLGLHPEAAQAGGVPPEPVTSEPATVAPAPSPSVPPETTPPVPAASEPLISGSLTGGGAAPLMRAHLAALRDAMDRLSTVQPQAWRGQLCDDAEREVNDLSVITAAREAGPGDQGRQVHEVRALLRQIASGIDEIRRTGPGTASDLARARVAALENAVRRL
ncbi:hypothetical protein ACIA8K_16420 [Catenuloplanes sp. NPDC051500]|uniref:hypothetical protein n=1 Tax=Catenuloplanes sp. NPDC051500 TaxID=3363959 RepID=UPI00379C8927